jgi:hypothetical protein
MTISLLAKNRLEMALRNNGYHIEHDVAGDWLAADATDAPGRCFVAYNPSASNRALVATSLPQVAREYSNEGAPLDPGFALPSGAVAVFAVSADALPAAVRRLFELSRSLPNAPLSRFVQKTRDLPKTTEVERLVVQRAGQEIFREALMDLWLKQCAVTGLDQPELLRASHIKPWSKCADDKERLDPFNGLLLAAHWDAAFDKGLVTFEEDGTARLSEKLSKRACRLLVPDASSPRRLAHVRSEHQAFLEYHRKNVWQQ